MSDRDSQSGLSRHPADVVETLIRERRSIRSYYSDPLPEGWIDAMLSCALQAPSPSNSQPVRFVRIDSQSYKEALYRGLTDGHERLLSGHKAMAGPARLRNWINAYRRYADFMFSAPHLLAVGVSTATIGFVDRLTEAGLMEKDRRHGTDLDITVGLALSGLMIKAQALGVGSCILTAPLVFIQDVEKMLGVEDITIKCFLTLGLPREIPAPTGRMSLDAAVKVI